MALIKCPECGKEISDQAPACIHCGFPLGDVKQEEVRESAPAVLEDREDGFIESPKEGGAKSQPKKEKYILGGVIAGVVILLAILIALVSSVLGDKTEGSLLPEETENESQTNSVKQPSSGNQAERDLFSAQDVLTFDFSNFHLDSDLDWYVVDVEITNNGDKPLKTVVADVAFRDADGNTLETFEVFYDSGVASNTSFKTDAPILDKGVDGKQVNSFAVDSYSYELGKADENGVVRYEINLIARSVDGYDDSGRRVYQGGSDEQPETAATSGSQTKLPLWERTESDIIQNIKRSLSEQNLFDNSFYTQKETTKDGTVIYPIAVDGVYTSCGFSFSKDIGTGKYLPNLLIYDTDEEDEMKAFIVGATALILEGDTKGRYPGLFSANDLLSDIIHEDMGEDSFVSMDIDGNKYMLAEEGEGLIFSIRKAS